MTDRTTKALLFAIAVGLWAHLAADFLAPVPVQAQSGIFGDPQLSAIERNTKNISMDTASMSGSLRSIALEATLRK